jgi:hypothetical protein
MSPSEWCQFALLLRAWALGDWVADHGYHGVGTALSTGAMVVSFQLGRKSGKRVSQEAGSQMRV